MISGGDKLVCNAGQKLIDYASPVDPNNTEAPYCIDKTEVTQPAFLGASFYERAKQAPYEIAEQFIGPKKPMIKIDWQQARDYCESRGGDLPTGIQWEKAARGPSGKIYPIEGDGKELVPGKANYSYEGSPHTLTDVGSFPASDGLFDMLGNVWEWTLEPTSFGTKILRGGSWGGNDAWVLRADYYSVDYPDYRSNHVGLRCVSAPRTPEA